MKLTRSIPFATILLAASATAVGIPCPSEATADDKLSASQIVSKLLEADPWGLGGAEVSARAIITDTSGKKRELAFNGKSRRTTSPLAKSTIAFTAPADVAGMKFLQVQNTEGDDERFLFTPELKRSRRIAAGNRNEAFMGTDFTYGDLDRRDVRFGTPKLDADEKIGKFDCYHLEIAPKKDDSLYGKVEMWVRKDNFVPLKTVMYDKSNAVAKTHITKELQRHGGKWFMTRSTMTDSKTNRTTELLLEKVDPKDDIPMDSFTVRTLEKG